MKIVFMGSADFGIPTLEFLRKSEEVVAVVSTPPGHKGRGLKLHDSPVSQYAKQHDVEPVITPPTVKDPAFIEQLRTLEADLFVVVAYRLLPPEVFSIPKLGTVNIHASLLPKYRGAAPIQRAIQAGESETGVTVFRIDEGIDTGEILLRKKIAIGSQESTPQLYERLSLLGAEALKEAVDGLKNEDLEPLKQDHTQALPAPKLKREEGHIRWNQSAQAIYNRIRAFKPFPGTYSFYDGKRLGIEWAQPQSDCESTFEPGQITGVSKSSFSVKCAQGCLRVLEVKPEGRKCMSVEAFLLGNKLNKGTELL